MGLSVSAVDPANPWGWDAFSDKPPKVDAPAPFKPAERTFPEEDRLFKVQRDALRAAELAEELQRREGRREASIVQSHTCTACGHRDRVVVAAPHGHGNLVGQLVEATGNTYKTIRSYLEKYVNGPTTTL
jgi:hypothetical protein